MRFNGALCYLERREYNVKKTQSYKSILILAIGVLSLTGCKTDFGNRNLYGRGPDHLLYNQLSQQFGGASYNADVGAYLVYNTTRPTSSPPQVNPSASAPGLDVVSPVDPNATGSTPADQIPGQGGVVTPYGSNFAGTGGMTNCAIRIFNIPEGGRNFITNSFAQTGVARTIGTPLCSPQSKIAVSARAVIVGGTGQNGNNIYYAPVSLNGGTLGHTEIPFSGTVGAIDAGDSQYFVASIAPDGRTYDTLAVLREAYVDRLGRSVPDVEYEVQLVGHEITDLSIDENHGMLYIATTFQGNFGKIIAYNLSDSDAFAQDNLVNVLQRSQAIMPQNTFLRQPFGQQQSAYAFDDGLGNSIFIMGSPPKSISNFDGLTAALTADGRIYVIEDMYGDSVPQQTREQLEQQWGTSIGDWDYLGSRSGYLWNSVRNTGSQHMFPGQLSQRYTDVAVGNNIFYAIGGDAVYYFMGDTGLILNSSVPRHRKFLMGNLNTISLNNQENIALITSQTGVKVCHVFGGNLNCGPSSNADLTEEANAAVLGGRIMPKTFTIERQPAEDITAEKENEETDS